MRLLRFLVWLAAVGLFFGVALGYGGPLCFDLDVLANLRLHMLGLSAAVALAALVLLARAALWPALMAAVLAAAGLGPLWAGPGPAGSGMPVTVMTANVYFRNAVPEAMRQALIAADADILLTVETPRDGVGGVPGADGTGGDGTGGDGTGGNGGAGPAALADIYPYHFIYRKPWPGWRTVLWSKFPIVQAEPALLYGKGSMAGLTAVIELASGRRLSLVGLHLSHVWKGDQARQIEALGGVTAGLPRPLVVMGDFNSTAWSWAVHRAQALTGTRRVGGVTRTWRGHYPTPFGEFPEPFGLPIDQLLVSAGIGVAAIDTVDIPGSDHDGLRAVLRVPE